MSQGINSKCDPNIWSSVLIRLYHIGCIYTRVVACYHTFDNAMSTLSTIYRDNEIVRVLFVCKINYVMKLMTNGHIQLDVQMYVLYAIAASVSVCMHTNIADTHTLTLFRDAAHELQMSDMSHQGFMLANVLVKIHLRGLPITPFIIILNTINMLL
jgi:hypothetical protein